MDLLYIWYDYKDWSKILFSTIPTTAYDLEVKVMDLEIYVRVLHQSFNEKMLTWIYFISGMIIDTGLKFYSPLFPHLLMT